MNALHRPLKQTLGMLRYGRLPSGQKIRRCQPWYMARLLLLTLSIIGWPTSKIGSAATSPSATQNARIKGGLNSISRDIDLDLPLSPAYRHQLLGHFSAIYSAGFRSIRFALPGFSYMNDQNRLDPRWINWLDARVESALKAGLVVIIDEHDSAFCSKNVLDCQKKLDAYWSQMSEHYARYSRDLIFEVLNEPHGEMTNAIWNRQIPTSLKIIRKSNPQRTVMIGPGNWYSIRSLSALDLPLDRNIIVTVHYYDPFEFTHQNAFWIQQTKDITNRHWGSSADHVKLENDFNVLAKWSSAHRQPINIGEFGTYFKGPLVDRLAWTSAVVQAAQSRGFSWNYWVFNFDQDQTDPDALIKDWGGKDIMSSLIGGGICNSPQPCKIKDQIEP